MNGRHDGAPRTSSKAPGRPALRRSRRVRVLLTVLVAVLAVAGAGAGLARWNVARVERSHRALAAELVARGAAGPARSLPELGALPAPVQRYLSRALPSSGTLPRTARLTQAGEILQSGRWRHFTAVQSIAIDPPGFVWDANIAFMPGLAVQVIDRYTAGTGGLVAKLAGTFTVAREEGTEAIAVGEMMRYAAELPWLPTTSVGPHVTWSSVDASTARARFHDAGRSVTLVFTFGDGGDVARVQGERPRSLPGGGTEVRPWVGRFWNYQEVDGVRVPMRGEVAWMMRDGPEPYWRGHILDASFDVR